MKLCTHCARIMSLDILGTGSLFSGTDGWEMFSTEPLPAFLRRIRSDGSGGSYLNVDCQFRPYDNWYVDESCGAHLLTAQTNITEAVASRLDLF
jgi:hypothetical protein